MLDTMQASGLKEPPAPLSLHFTSPIVTVEGFAASDIVAVNVIGVPAVACTGFGVTVVTVVSITLEDNLSEPVLD